MVGEALDWERGCGDGVGLKGCAGLSGNGVVRVVVGVVDICLGCDIESAKEVWVADCAVVEDVTEVLLIVS